MAAALKPATVALNRISLRSRLGERRLPPAGGFTKLQPASSAAPSVAEAPLGDAGGAAARAVIEQRIRDAWDAQNSRPLLASLLGLRRPTSRFATSILNLASATLVAAWAVSGAHLARRLVEKLR